MLLKQSDPSLWQHNVAMNIVQIHITKMTNERHMGVVQLI